MSSAKSTTSLKLLFSKVAQKSTANRTIESAASTADPAVKKETQLSAKHSAIQKFLEEGQSDSSLNRPRPSKEGLQLHRKWVRDEISSHSIEKPSRSIGDLISEGLEVGGSAETETGKTSNQLPAVSSTGLGRYRDLLADDTDDTNRSRVAKISFTATGNYLKSRHSKEKEKLREQKKKWVHKNTSDGKFDQLIKICADKLGSDVAIQHFHKLRRETGLKEYDSLISQCIETAKSVKDERAKLKQIHHAFGLLYSMKEQGFSIEEQTYGPVLLFLIDMHAKHEFYSFLEVINDTNVAARLGYYEMLLAIEINDETKIRDLCNRIAAQDRSSESESVLHENYIMALCQRDQSNELLQVMKTLDITRVSSLDSLSCIFKSLGRLAMKSSAEKFILELKDSDLWAESASVLLLDYVTNMLNLETEEVTLRYLEIHAKLEVVPSCASYKKLIRFFCHLRKVNEALNIIDRMYVAGLLPTIDTFNMILEACESNYDYHLVPRIYSLVSHLSEKPHVQTVVAYNYMIKLCVRMKDLNTAHSLLKELEMLRIPPTATMYNAIIGCLYKEGNSYAVLKTIKEMELAGVKPTSQTFSYLIKMSETVDDIDKHFEKFKSSNVVATKHVFMALIHAYASCGHFDKAKEILLSKDIPILDFSDIKSALVSVLSANGKVDDAFKVYEEIKQARSYLAPSAVISLIEYCDSSIEPSRLLCFINEVKDKKYWVDACRRAIKRFVNDKNLRSAVVLLNELLAKVEDDKYMEVTINEIFAQVAEMDPPDVQYGLDLLHAIKDELNLQPPRRSLDFLLGACVIAKDLKSADLVWKQFQAAQLPYNVLSYLRMYQVLMACGDKKSAAKIYTKIDREDLHVQAIITSFQLVYGPSLKKRGKNPKKQLNS